LIKRLELALIKVGKLTIVVTWLELASSRAHVLELLLLLIEIEFVLVVMQKDFGVAFIESLFIDILGQGPDLLV
jgi:hypothetical protein